MYAPIKCGPLPVDLINSVLGTELEPGEVRLSARAHRHIAEDHAVDYAICIAALVEAVAAPTFIGQAPHQVDSFELVRRINHPDGKSVLVAIGLECDDYGDYRVRSAYLIEEAKVTARRLAGRLRVPIPK
jgi:hypothetical protein